MQHDEPLPAAVTASTRFTRPTDPDRDAADVGYQESARAGRAISQRPAPSDSARIRAALIGDIPARMGLTEDELRAFTRGTLDRAQLPAEAQCRFAELARTLGGSFWPRKIAAVLWGIHAQTKRNAG